ncbi:MAG: flavodoxin-dependent (E)-4-hydroxy-3-methylbut-2-enyl-diphosphate synthase [Clostridia bacterium]
MKEMIGDLKMTREIKVRNLTIGGGASLTVQSMTNTDTRDVAATVNQILELERAGCDIARFSVYDGECVAAVKKIRDKTHIPLVADVHFDYRLAIGAIENGIDKLRFNPGNIGSESNVEALVSCAKAHKTPIRIGVNSGSLEKDILKELGATSEAAVKSAMKHVRLLESFGFYDIVISIKMSSVTATVDAYKKISALVDYPLHIGVTESGTGDEGLIKSSIGIGSLLLSGIGDTLRVSLTGDPVNEVKAGLSILAALGLRSAVDIVSCPTCGRTTGDILGIVEKLKREYRGARANVKIAVMGCVVNGPGEAREADIGIAFAPGGAVVFKKGERAYNGETDETLFRFFKDVKEIIDERTSTGAG